MLMIPSETAAILQAIDALLAATLEQAEANKRAGGRAREALAILRTGITTAQQYITLTLKERTCADHSTDQPRP